MFRPNFHHREGVAAVEAAVCLPILVIIMLGAVEVSNGIIQQYNAQACAYEISKIAMRSKTSCGDVQAMAAQIMPELDFDQYSIKIEVVTRSVNVDSVETPNDTLFNIPKSGGAPAGLEDIPRGTLLKLTLTATRPPLGSAIPTSFLDSEILSDCVFVKEF